MTGISWMLQEAGQCPQADYVVYDTHEEEEGSVDDELSGSGEFPEYVDTMEYEYTYDAKSDKASIYRTPFKFPTWLISVLNFIGNIWFLLCWGLEGTITWNKIEKHVKQLWNCYLMHICMN